MSRRMVRLSKTLSYVLRHRPDSIGLTVDEGGWIPVDELLAAWRRHQEPISRAELEEVVATSDKRRFSFSPDGLRIRANQGHSVSVDLGLEPIDPPEHLYHGTVARFLDSIRVKGKKKPVKVYELIGRKDNGLPEKIQKLRKTYEEGIEKYLAREWDAGIDAFNKALGIVPDDGPSKVYIDRCLAFKENPPPDDWDGVFTMTTK